MKTIKLIISGITLLITFSGISIAQKVDSIVMGAGYANDVYYSMANGVVKSEPNTNWHIAFSTGAFSSSILTNDGNGVKLYSYPYGDYMSWETVKIDSIASWNPQYNSPEDWMEGAFDRNALGHPDYGWGVYNSTSHDVIGDSLFILQYSQDAIVKKFRVEKKLSMQNTYIIHYANIDGSESVSDTLKIGPYTSKNFVYYSLETGDLVDREPEASWDIVFSRYYDDRIPYNVTGVLSNTGIKVARIEQADTSLSCFGQIELKTTRSVIGYDWKSINMQTYQWEIQDSLVFVILDTSNVLQNLYFTSFSGTGSGIAKFVLPLTTCGLGISQSAETNALVVFPNPATEEISIRHRLNGNAPANLQLFDMTGRMVINQTVQLLGDQVLKLNATSLESGVYLLRLSQKEQSASARIIIR